MLNGERKYDGQARESLRIASRERGERPGRGTLMTRSRAECARFALGEREERDHHGSPRIVPEICPSPPYKYRMVCEIENVESPISNFSV